MKKNIKIKSVCMGGYQVAGKMLCHHEFASWPEKKSTDICYVDVDKNKYCKECGEHKYLESQLHDIEYEIFDAHTSDEESIIEDDDDEITISFDDYDFDCDVNDDNEMDISCTLTRQNALPGYLNS